ncbi:MAG: hypothetical protein LBQ15_08015 [Clostridium sp.]|jgi:hypothetical protein|nr:hypothetical protein [Clostridium sp.]
MKFAKRISLFLIYPAVMLSVGFLGGVSFMNYFYPGRMQNQTQNAAGDWQEEGFELEAASPGAQGLPGGETEKASPETEGLPEGETEGAAPEADGFSANGKAVNSSGAGEIPEGETAGLPGAAQKLPKDLVGGAQAASQEAAGRAFMGVSSSGSRITADTQYVLEETDIRNRTVVETTWEVPAKYIGMNREQFLEAMEEYETAPPLSELERGFVGLEVLSFSAEKVVVQMNYEYTQPTSSFYLKVENNFVVVYLDDQETVYMYTDILLTDLPEYLRQEIIQVMFVPDEESLYDFLEAYSS